MQAGLDGVDISIFLCFFWSPTHHFSEFHDKSGTFIIMVTDWYG
jgi:hypothetical protein